MTVYLCNKDPIDLNTITLMGVSVKTGKSPIGYFGTGLKYAIATLLRTDHKVSLYRDGELINFGTEKTEVRDEEFDVVTMQREGMAKPTTLAFTTALGRNWEVWQAYRELRSNCIDENGEVITDHVPGCQDFGTIFAIRGDAFENCQNNRHEIFLESTPLFDGDSMSIHAGSNMTVFYRGVRASKTNQPTLFTYNLKTSTELTEDRTIKNPFFIEYYAKASIIKCDDEELIEKILMAPKETFEWGFEFEKESEPSAAFMNVVERNHHSVYCNASAVKCWLHHSYQPLSYDPVPLDDYELAQLTTALTLCKRLGATMELGKDFIVVDGLGEGIFGCVRENTIYLSHSAFDIGHRFVASTLYEEWLHKFQGMKDEDRNMQNLLFEKLLAMTEKLVALEGKR